MCDYRNYDEPLEVRKFESHTSHLTGMDVKLLRHKNCRQHVYVKPIKTWKITMIKGATNEVN